MTRAAAYLVAASLAGAIVVAQTDQALTITAASRSQSPGEVVVLTIASPSAIDSLRVEAFGQDVAAYQTSPSRWQAIVGIDLDVKPGEYPVSVEAGAARTTYTLAVAPHAFPTRRLKVDEAFVNPPASQQRRIEEDARLIAHAYASSPGERLWEGPFVRPVPDAANSRFGTRSIFNGVPRNPHGGADFLSPAGTPIHAPNAGRVVIARNLYFTGNTVLIDHGLGLFSMLAHLSAFDVHEGESVSAGQVVGKVGATGRVTGPHLHWAFRANGARVDPLSVLKLLGQS